MATSNEVSPASAAGSRRVRTALVASALAVLSLGVLYWSYYSRRSEYLVSRDLRLLSVAAAQIGTRLESRKQIVRNFAETAFWRDLQGNDILTYPSKGAEEKQLAPYLADFTDLRRGSQATQDTEIPDPKKSGDFRVTQESGTVRIEYWGKIPAPAVAGKPERHGYSAGEQPHAVGRLTLDTMITPVLDKPLFGVFDNVFIASPSDNVFTASSSAEVLKQVQPHGSQTQHGILSRSVHSTSHDAPALVLASLGSIRDRASKDGDLKVSALQHETQVSDVEISGHRYVLLTQPFTFESQHWIIGGLIDRRNFIRDATEISMSIIELVVAALVLLVCCWPFLKVAFSGPGEPTTRADVVMGGVATLLASGMIALLLADVFAYNHIKSIADAQQRSFAASMADDLHLGVDRIVKASDRLQKSTWDAASHYQATDEPHSEGDFKTKLEASTVPFTYTFFSSAAWVNDEGDQVVQVAMQGGDPPLPPVAKRQYFQTLRKGGEAHPWTWIDDRKVAHQFVIEPVRALTTGASEAVIAFPVRDESLAKLSAFTVTFPFVEATEHLESPDISYAIIDQNGNVMFGSDSDRNGIENVFTETDQNRELRAAVGARQDDFVDTQYWGEDARILVTPLNGLPWTLLTFRDKRLLRTMNLETLAITMTLFLFYLGAIVLTIVATLLLRPKYRMPWVWPVEKQLLRWKRVRLLYVVTGVAFVLVIYSLASAARLTAAALVPVYAFLGTYLILNDGSKRLAYGLSVIAWTAITLRLAWGGLYATFAREVINSGAVEASIRAVLLFCLLLASLCVVIRPADLPRVRWREFARTYIACGVLFVILISILPMIACFQAALTIELEALVKSSQRRMADMFIQRIEQLTEKSWASSANIATSYPIPSFYESYWCIQPNWGYKSPCGFASTASLSSLSLSPREPFVLARNKVGEVIEEHLPVYTEGSLEMRALQSGGADDSSWYALRARRVLALSRNLDLSDRAGKKLIAEFTQAARPGTVSAARLADWTEQISSGKAQLTIVSRLPSMLPDWLRPDDPIRPFPSKEGDFLPNEPGAAFPHHGQDPEIPQWVRVMAYVFAAVVVSGLLLWAVRFAARRIFLYDLREPRWLEPPLRPPFGEHLFLVHAPANLATFIDVNDVQRLSFNELRDIEPYFDELGPPGYRWADRMGLIDSDSKRAILCEGFGDDLGDVELTSRKFDFIESMLRLTDCTIIISSPVSPALLLNLYGDLDAATRARWEAVLGVFVWIDETRLLPRAAASVHDDTPVLSAWERVVARWRDLPKVPMRIEAAWRNLPLSLMNVLKGVRTWFLQFTAKGREARDREEDGAWIERETAPSAFLLSFAARLRSLPGGRGQMLDELREGAERYYQALWTMCSRPERVVLYHVAHYGVANSNNRRVIRRLIARGILRRDGELRLFTSTFRLFVLARADEIREQCESEPESRSTFDRIRVPLFVAILIVLGVIVGTQKELASATTAILTALATGLPMILKLIGTFTDRRVGTVEH